MTADTINKVVGQHVDTLRIIVSKDPNHDEKRVCVGLGEERGREGRGDGRGREGRGERGRERGEGTGGEAKSLSLAYHFNYHYPDIFLHQDVQRREPFVCVSTCRTEKSGGLGVWVKEGAGEGGGEGEGVQSQSNPNVLPGVVKHRDCGLAQSNDWTGVT